MPRGELALSGYRPMWLFAMFDLPVLTRTDRREYARFRKLLLKQGFCMLQFSVYARYLPSEEAAEPHKRTIEAGLPPTGQVRLLAVTDRQFGRMSVFFGKKRAAPEAVPVQLMLF
ncbi:MAG: CRISPR-associated endonuclease Cas2 [Planctomycetia bacterium]|nr:MAG: CRISPR-associated endonuclease Cas2 [Planctomycetia bacterium]